MKHEEKIQYLVTALLYWTHEIKNAEDDFLSYSEEYNNGTSEERRAISSKHHVPHEWLDKKHEYTIKLDKELNKHDLFLLKKRFGLLW